MLNKASMSSRMIICISLCWFLAAVVASGNEGEILKVRENEPRAKSGRVNFSRAGISGFQGQNGPAIGSWFRTNDPRDFTNGHSWCGFPYNDMTKGFAPNVKIMLDNFGGDYEKAAKAYCGLEATVTLSNGRRQKMYVVDGFDPKWVRTPGSIDIPRGQFAKLRGSGTDDKNVVIQGLTWKFTGRRSSQYTFKGRGN